MRTKTLGIAIAAAMIGLAGTAVADGKNWTADKAAQVSINRQSNCGYGAGNNQVKDAWQGVDRAGFKNLGEELGGTYIGSGGPGGYGFGEKPYEPETELDPGNSNCGDAGSSQ